MKSLLDLYCDYKAKARLFLLSMFLSTTAYIPPPQQSTSIVCTQQYHLHGKRHSQKGRKKSTLFPFPFPFPI